LGDIFLEQNAPNAKIYRPNGEISPNVLTLLPDYWKMAALGKTAASSHDAKKQMTTRQGRMCIGLACPSVKNHRCQYL
jgi:hypothetical protein